MNRTWAKGYYTPEMTLLMALILPMLITLMIAGFYIHDRNCMQSEACELAMLESCMLIYEDREQRVAKRTGELSGGRLSWTSGVSAQAAGSVDSAQAKLTGEFPLPGMIAQFWSGGKLSMEESWERKIPRPASQIRKMRGAKDAAGQLRQSG